MVSITKNPRCQIFCGPHADACLLHDNSRLTQDISLMFCRHISEETFSDTPAENKLHSDFTTVSSTKHRKEKKESFFYKTLNQC